MAEIEIDKDSETLDEAYLRVYKDIIKRDLLGHEDLALSRAWINDLKRLHYEFPKLVKNANGYNFKDPKVVDQRDVGPGVVKDLNKHYDFRVRRSLRANNSESFQQDVQKILQDNNLI